MQIIQSKATIKNGIIMIDKPHENLPNNQDIEVIILLKNETKQEEFEKARQEMQIAFKEAGIETREQILDLIHQVKLELFKERNQ